MKFLGIDYGSKRIGTALSDESNTFALPLKVLENTSSVIDDVNTIVCDNEITHIVMGESKNFKGEDNKIMADITRFKEKIENMLKLPVILEPEFMTSAHAEKFQGKNDLHDASAAALILQSYLDRLKNMNQ